MNRRFMDITKELAQAQERRAETVNRLNALRAQQQEVLQEVLRIDGEVRLLQRLSQNGDKPKAS